MDEAAVLAALRVAVAARNAREVDPFRDVFAAHAAATAAGRDAARRAAELGAEAAALRRERETLTSALRHSEEAATRGAAALELQQKLERLQTELAQSYKACAEASQAALAARDAAAARDADVARLSAELAATRADLAAARARITDLAAALEREKAVAAAASDELEARLADKEEAEARLARLQVEHLDLTQRFMEYKAGETQRLNEIQKLHEEVTTAKAVAAAAAAAASAAAAAGGVPLGPATPDGGGAGDEATAAAAAAARPLPRAARHTLRAAAAATHALAYSPNGAQLATAGEDKLINVWDPGSGVLLGTLRGALGAVLDVAWSPCGKLVLGAGTDRALRLWEASSGRVRHTLTGHGDKVVAAAFAPAAEGDRCYSAGHDRALKAWDVGRGYCVATLLCASNVNCCAAGLAGGLLASGHFDGGVRFWDPRAAAAAAGRPAHELAGLHPASQVTSCAACPRRGGAELLTCGRDNALRVVDVRTFGVVATMRHATFRVGTNFARAAWSPDARHAAAGGADGAVCVWQLPPQGGSGSEGTLAAMLRGHAAPVAACAWSPAAAAQLGSCDKAGVTLLWEA